MKTSSFALYQGPGRVCIARYAPRGTPAGFRIFKALAPTKPMLKMSYRPYRDMYFRDILGRLDPRETWNALHEMADYHEPVLLCWEKLQKRGEWCHRRLVAQWFEMEIGEVVEERVTLV